MSLLLSILQVFLFTLFWFCLRTLTLIYRYRLLVIKHEFNFSVSFHWLVWLIRWVILPLAFLGIISDIVGTRNYLLIIVLFGGFILPLLFFLGKKPSNFFLSAIDDYFYSRRTKIFDSCPHCNKSKVFYCHLYEVTPESLEVGELIDECYYLVNKEGQLYSLGFILDPESPALAFVQEPEKFDIYINKFFPLLELYQSSNNLFEFDDIVLWQEPYLYCSNCHEQVNQSPIFYGTTILK